MADITTRPYGRTRRTSPDRAGWARLCARYEVLAARMGMAATEAGGHCSEYYFILVRPRRPRCDDACRAKLCAPHQTVRSCFAAQTEHELAWKVQSAFRVLASSAFCAVRYILLRFIFRPHCTTACADDDWWARLRWAMAAVLLVMTAARCRQRAVIGADRDPAHGFQCWPDFPEPAPSRGKMDHGHSE